MRINRRWTPLSGILAAVVLVAVGCGAPKIALQRSDRIPAAEGQVTVSNGPNDNTRLIIQVKHLAPASRLDPMATGYVAWAMSPQGALPPQNLGAIVVDKNLSGRLETVTTKRDFQLIVTAESAPGGDYPTTAALLSAMVRRW